MNQASKILSIAFVIAFQCSCVSLEKDIYFKAVDSNLSAIAQNREILPGRNFSLRIQVDGEKDRQLNFVIENRSAGSYLWGIGIPILPVFFLPGFKFNLDKAEKLKLTCTVGYYYELKQGEDGFQRLSDEALALSKGSKKNGPDVCVTVDISTEDHLKVHPISIETSKGTAVFTYEINAADINNFIIEDTVISLRNGKRFKSRTQIEVAKKDWTRYYIPSINN